LLFARSSLSCSLLFAFCRSSVSFTERFTGLFRVWDGYCLGTDHLSLLVPRRRRCCRRLLSFDGCRRFLFDCSFHRSFSRVGGCLLMLFALCLFVGRTFVSVVRLQTSVVDFFMNLCAGFHVFI
jgi:hypothetical protein